MIKLHKISEYVNGKNEDKISVCFIKEVTGLGGLAVQKKFATLSLAVGTTLAEAEAQLDPDKDYTGIVKFSEPDADGFHRAMLA